MIRNYRIRKLIAPTVALAKAILLFLVGSTLFLLGLALSVQERIRPGIDHLLAKTYEVVGRFSGPGTVETTTYLIGGALLVLGMYLAFRGLRAGVRHMLETLMPGMKSGMVDVYVRRQQLAHGPRIVALGGGTGLSTLLRGLKQHSSNITAIVTVSDDGGSSGKLIQDKGMIPPGDIRNCLVALADAEKAMTDLFQHRFKNDSGSLSGHSTGNLLIAALLDQYHGDFDLAVEAASDVLAIRGRVVPSTLDHVRLRAVLENGTEVCGETAIANAGGKIRQVFLDPEIVQPYHLAIEAIGSADLICIGPGSVFTSVIPPLLVPGIIDALRASKALKVYICNVMTQPGESDSFSAAEHVTAIQLHVKSKVFDYVVVNTGVPSESALEKYREVGQHLVENDSERIRAMGFRIIAGNFMSETDFVRHDPMKVASRLFSLLAR
jgi:uncharacterized cofD-like protein